MKSGWSGGGGILKDDLGDSGARDSRRLSIVAVITLVFQRFDGA
jgi:hypothetical protein